ncbi:MAG: hypothetical protein FJ255_03745 [Phycisphaerae bacterium]|nr:hypothetical protein [Phycisphaerae bacterium]
MRDDPTIIRRWFEAAQAPAVVADLERLFAAVADEVERRGPACWASGRCCNFERAGHRLYVTGLEAAYALARPPPTPAPRALSLPQVEAARAAGGCPFQAANLCTIHATKPLTCRIYFCDRSATAWQQDLSERMLAPLRTLHDTHAVPYRYAEWRSLLEAILRTRPRNE